MEAFMEMDDENLTEVLALITKWWNEEYIPDEILQSRVILLFKQRQYSREWCRVEVSFYSFKLTSFAH